MCARVAGPPSVLHDTPARSATSAPSGQRRPRPVMPPCARDARPCREWRGSTLVPLRTLGAAMLL